MKPLFTLIRFLWRHEKKALVRGLLLSIAVLAAGIALLGLSGWFILAAGAAGLAGSGKLFDFFRPSAGVRFLALGRSAARYGERMFTHDATLRALARLRVQILHHLTAADFGTMTRMRSADVLNRMTSDIDALDGLAIRLVFPALAGLFTLIVSAVLLAWLVDWRLALVVVGSLVVLTLVIFVILAKAAFTPSEQAATVLQTLREDTVEHLRGRDVLTMAGVLGEKSAVLENIEKEQRAAQWQVTRQEIVAGAGLEIVGALASTLALAGGGLLVLNGQISPAIAGLAFFASLALFETVAPLRRGMAELGKMQDAARRICRYVQPLPENNHEITGTNTRCSSLELRGLQIERAGQPLLPAPLYLEAKSGETIALSGASGIGKSTVLNAIAGLIPTEPGQILFDTRGVETFSESRLRELVGYLPQRSSLISGTIRDTLGLGTDASDAQMLEVLDAVALKEVVQTKNGLDTKLGEAGAGLSGGQKKRLCLARTLLRKPSLLLLDEVTEGLDHDTARHVLTGIRAFLPEAIVILAAHRKVELEVAVRVIKLDAK